jgi:hypothetical protein
MSFFSELKRRNVIRVGIAYVVVGQGGRLSRCGPVRNHWRTSSAKLSSKMHSSVSTIQLAPLF